MNKDEPKRIIFTGGGTAGHVIPNLALIDRFKNDGWSIYYIGTKQGIERGLIAQAQDIAYIPIASGKLRRYFSWENFIDPFRIVGGLFQAAAAAHRIKPAIIFSKGGFVTVPVVIGGWLNRIPVVIHESDITPGLANKLSAPFAKKVCTTFIETAEHIKHGKGIYTGAIVRPELLQGSRESGLRRCGFSGEKPILLIIGGSLGAVAINTCVRASLPELLKTFDIIHICGKNNLDLSLQAKGYRQFDYVTEELPDLMACADVVVSRAGANAIFELLALRKPSVLIPYPRSASRGDQLLNAASFEKQGFCDVLYQERMTEETLSAAVLSVYRNRDRYIRAMNASNANNGIDNVCAILLSLAK